MNARRKTTRREFLQGQSARDALNDLSRGAVPAGTEPPGSVVESPHACQDYLLQVGRIAMACDFHVFLNAGQHAGAVEAATAALDAVQQLEAQMSIFRPDSELSVINREAAQHPCVVEFQLFELLSRCVQWSQATAGAYDITAGPLVKVWGFHRRAGQFPAPEQVSAALQQVGSQYLELDRERQSIFFGRPGMELNLGSVGKGYALDRCADLLAAAGVNDFLIHGGHSSILARGARDMASAVPEWSIALRHPLRAERRLAELKLCNRALGTSGSGQQFFYHRGRRYGHVLDPRTGMPADRVLSATVLAPNAAEADALATAFFVLGVEDTRAYCESHPDLTVVFVIPGTRAGTVAIETVGVPTPLQVLDETASDHSRS